MNENMDAKEPSADASGENAAESPAGAKLGANHVFQVFRQDKMALAAVIGLSVMMEIALLFIFMIMTWQILPLPPIVLLILLALALVPGCIVRWRFTDDVIPSCRGVCSEEEIVSGAWKSLAYMWEVCFLCMLPLIAIVLKTIIFHDPQTGHPYDDFGDSIVLSCIAALLGYCPLAVFPVARMFSRRAGMIVMLILIILGQIVMMLHTLFGVSGLFYLGGGGDAAVRSFNSFSGFLCSICAMLSLGGLGYFIYAAIHDAEEKGLLY